MEKLVIYSTNCPRCKILIKKLETAGFTDYEVINDVKEMQSLGITTVPMMSVNGGRIMDFKTSIDWINAQEERDGNN
ncbi:MAG: hypothetical protein IKU01_01570 [Bacteroidales bacterium]|nr:hypothetical protein [Bacteroidales bacterium]